MNVEIEIPGLADAQAQLAAANTKKERLSARRDTASSAVAAAKAARAALIKRTGEGEELGGEIAAVDEKLRGAESQLAVFEEAMPEAEKAIAQAHGQCEAARAKQRDKELVSLIEARLELADEADELGKVLTAWLQRWRENSSQLSDAVGFMSEITSEHLESLRAFKDTVCFIPRPMQIIIVQTASAVNYSISDRTKIAWDGMMTAIRTRIGKATN